MLNRKVAALIEKDMFAGKAILLYGGRQTGKTTLIRELLNKRNDDYLFLNDDEPDVRDKLANISSTQWKILSGNKRVIFIDEAQRIDNIGIAIKLITDQLPEIQVIATGSSSLELASRSSLFYSYRPL